MIKPADLQDLFPGEDVGLVFTEDFRKRVMLPGSEILRFGTGWSQDFQSLFLFTQIQKEDFIIASMIASATLWW